MSIALFSNETGKLVCFKPLASKPGHTIRELSTQDRATCKAANGRPLKWENGAVVLDSIAPSTLKPLKRKQFQRLLVALNIEEEQIVAFIESAYQDATQRKLALIEYRDSDTYLRTHPLTVAAIAALQLDENDVNEKWLAESRK